MALLFRAGGGGGGGGGDHLCNFDRRQHIAQFCEMILNFDQWFKRRCHLKIFLIWSSGGPFVQGS